MKTLLLNTFDSYGGAARAAYRLHTGLRGIGVDSRMLVINKTGQDEFVDALPYWLKRWMRWQYIRLNRAPLDLYKNRSRSVIWSTNWVPVPTAAMINRLPADLFHLHWIGDGFIPVAGIGRLNRPIVWTLHDQWAFTGGCHYSSECDRYGNACGSCPQLGSVHEWDLSRYGWNEKRNAYTRANITVVSPSRWLASRAQASSLLGQRRIEVIPNGIDTQQYRPLDQQATRAQLGLPLDRRLIMFGSMSSTSDPRKGFQFLHSALQRLAQVWNDRAELVIFGADKPTNPPNFGLKAHYLGTISDESKLAQIYAAADVFVAPSMQENLPNTIMEALACGTPSVAFNIGGIPDLIDHQQNGYLAHPYEIEDLAHGIEWVLEDAERHTRLATNARQKVEAEFELSMIAQRYVELYEDVIRKSALAG